MNKSVLITGYLYDVTHKDKTITKNCVIECEQPYSAQENQLQKIKKKLQKTTTTYFAGDKIINIRLKFKTTIKININN